MEEVGDDQSAELIYVILSKLQDELNISDGAKTALNRINTISEHTKEWDPALLRNNIFKAANSLGIYLPSGMF
jgi:hypothetical protein